MKSIIFMLGIWTSILLVCSVMATESELLKLLPQDDDITGWLRDGEAYIATDEASLSGFINGAAPFYIERGAQEVLFQDYAKDDVYLTVEIYRMAEAEQARQLYADVGAEEPEALEDIGTEARFVGGLVGAYLVEYWHTSLFVRLTITEKSPAAQDAILAFAKGISEKI